MDTSTATNATWLQRFFQELKHRRVMRVATLYIILFWPIIQVADILSPALGLPPEAMRYLLIVFSVGFPVALTLSWLFDLNRSGIVRATGAEQPAERALLGRTIERSIIGMLVLVIVVLFYFQYWSAPERAVSGPVEPNVSAGIQALAVLPFATFSENSEDRFFADGLTEELLNALSQLQNLQVRARTSSFAYKGVNKNVQDIGYELSVDTILEGSVRRNDIDDTIRITAQLIDVETGAHIWSKSFDRKYHDVFQIQDDIAAAVVSQLKLTLLANEQARIRPTKSTSPEAMVVFSMGRAEIQKGTQISLQDAVRFFNKAIAADPQYADAYAELAKSHTLIYNYGDRSPEHLAKAERAVKKAIELDPDSAEGWAAYGLLYTQRNDYESATTSLRKALSLNPSHAMANMWLGQIQTDPVQRRVYYERAFELDPRSPVAGYNVAFDLFQSGRDREAMKVFGQIMEADPYYPQAYELVGRINESHGRLVMAVQHYERAIELDPRSETAMRLAAVYVDIGDFDSADRWIEQAFDDRITAGKERLWSSELIWLRISSLVARGDETAAQIEMRKLLQDTTVDRETFSDKAVAAYFLSEPQLAVDAWELNQQQKMPTTGMNGHALQNVEERIAAAYAYTHLGRGDEAEPILANLESDLEAQLNSPERVNPKWWYVKAQVMAIRGESKLALQHLQRAIDQGWRQHWRPFVEPCMESLLEMQTFQSMMAGLAARMQLMGEQLEFDGLFAAVTRQSA